VKIGVIDSGLGGLTVAAAIRHRFPTAELHYLGDTARVPYGTRDAETITAFARELLAYELGCGVDVLVVACNTISAIALDALRAASPIPIVDVIVPTVAAAAATGAASIGVIGTRATIRSHIYRDQLMAINASLVVREVACPLFVPVVEEGYVGTLVGQDIVREQLTELRADPPELLLLGCTHYPYLRAEIERVLPTTRVLDSATATVEALAATLEGVSGTEGNGEPSITLTMTSPALDRLLPTDLRPMTLTILPPEALRA
jgi:glutamate racemase